MNDNGIHPLVMRYAEICLKESRAELSQEEEHERIRIREQLGMSHVEILKLAKNTIAPD